MLIVFIGADGSGKTSVANALAYKLSDRFNEIKRFHTIFGIISRLGLGSFIRSIFRKKDVGVDSRQKDGFYDYPEPFSALRASFILMKISADYFLGHFIANKFTKSKNLLIFDRYFYEFFTEEHFRKQPRWTLRFYKFILPKPDLVVFLYNDPEVIFKRKLEQSIDQIRVHNERNQNIIYDLPYGIRIKTDASIEEIASEIESRVLDII